MNKLTYLFALIENSSVKFDYHNTPRPTGRSIIACQRMMERLKGTLKNELEALMSSEPINDAAGTPKKTPTPRKRKAKGDAAADGQGEVKTLTKRGRKAKVVEEEKEVAGDDDEDLTVVKPEPKEEEIEDEI
ncbi:hypothetical protein G6011_02648 [Alternaria panax]|uniref:Uncharacterized protein n=1 Tax=Alternaria panax TaxID=48097 RepID=A0AAD4FAA2_9PLEO|nr:hypothetical protein G6011_02648 [Alternaria panax]